MKLRVNLLVKSELTYELLGRNIQTFSDDSTVIDLRKLLRVHQEASFDARNLIDKINADDELVLIEEKLSNLETYIGELSSRYVSKILRAETKLNHLDLRCSTLLLFKMSEENIKRCQSFQKKIDALKEAVAAVGVDEETKEQVFRRLSEDLEDEEELDDVFSKIDKECGSSKTVNKPTTAATQVTHSSTGNVISQSMLVSDTSTISSFSNMRPIMSQAPVSNVGLGHNYQVPNNMINSDTYNIDQSQSCQSNLNIYSKLPNPIEKYLKMFKSTNGLNVTELLNFIKVCLKMSNELKLTSNIVIDLATSYSHGPLLGKMLELKAQNSTLEQMHVELLRCFVPINLRESLRKNLVNRPQKVGEPLSIYCNDLRENAKILLCPYTETELVQIIKLGISPQDRSRLVFVGNPVTFADLDSLCIQTQNMAYSDYLRNTGSGKGSQFVHTVNTATPEPMNKPRVCYFCQRPGHIARFCYRKNKLNKQSL